MIIIDRRLNSRTEPNVATERASRAVQSRAARFERCARTVSCCPRRGDVWKTKRRRRQIVRREPVEETARPPP